MDHAEDCIVRCRALALHSEEPGKTTRTFLSHPMRAVHADLTRWMQQCGMRTHVDAAGNLHGVYSASRPDAPVLFIGSHLDTVPNAGAFDGILGVVLGVKLVEMLEGRRLSFDIEVVGFSEEEGVRFGFPFIGSKAFIGDLDHSSLAREDASGISVANAIRAYGLNPNAMESAVAREPALGYFELHIEQGPVLESLGLAVGVVEAIAGQSRLRIIFEGKAGHAGTTPMNLRRDALAGASAWICEVEKEAASIPDLVATVGRIEAQPGAPNVIAGLVTLSLDVRHADDAVRGATVARLIARAEGIAAARRLQVNAEVRTNQPAVAMEPSLSQLLTRAVTKAGRPPRKMLSGAGHDAMIVANRMPTAMLFLRSPGGISHHPDESVLAEDVAVALECGLKFLHELEVRA